MDLTLKIWRQNGPDDRGAMREYQVEGTSEGLSFLEMFDILNEDLLARGEEPIAFDSDCREGICSQRDIIINGIAHGPGITTTYQPHMGTFHDGDVITIEPWYANAFPLIEDLVVDRNALNRIIQAGGYISVNTGAVPNAHVAPVPKQGAGRVFEAAACIGCDTCMTACPNTLAILFASAKIIHPRFLPQGRPENCKRVVNVLNQTDEEGFGTCSNIGKYAAVCLRQIPLDVIATFNRQLGKAALRGI